MHIDLILGPCVEDSNAGFQIAYSWLLLSCASVGGGSSLDDGLIVTSSWSAAACRLFVFSNILASASAMARPICIIPLLSKCCPFVYFAEVIPLVKGKFFYLRM